MADATLENFAKVLRLLTFSTLYPNAAAPAHGVFVENRLAAWISRSGGEAKVIAPVPWFPSQNRIFGRYARFARAPLHETRRGIEVDHPRYFLAPKVGMNDAPAALARALTLQAQRLISNGYEFDLIDAHYLYPDGVAAIEAARALGKPVVLTARGSDVTRLPDFPRPREKILDAIRRADAVIAVSEALRADMIRLGAPAEKIAVLRNGVDLDLFRPLDRNRARAEINADGRVIASVGGLIARKGHDIAIRAIARLPGATLLIVGEGEEERRLKTLAKSLGVADRIRFLGARPHESLASIYNAADALILASTREGWPNVLLEAMACGTPVVAADAGGAGEIVGAPAAGRIVGARTPEAFAAALNDVIANADRGATRAFAEGFSWDETSDGLTAIYSAIVSRERMWKSVRITSAAPPVDEAPRLILTVDTEELFDWETFDANAHQLARPADIDRFQTLCEGAGFKPLYFVTWPLLTDAETAGYFRRLAEEGRADLGVHPHQWNTPPLGGFAGEYYSWQSNLPRDVHAAKIASISAAFENAFGFRPRAHRAGRYGVSASVLADLAGAGFKFDFSPSAAFDFSARGGPDFSGAPNAPMIAATGAGDILVMPVTGAFAIRGGRAFLKQPDAAALDNPRRKLPRGLFAPFRLSPEGARYGELVSLTKSIGESGGRFFCFSIHSSTMTPGANSYAPDGAAVDAILALTRRYLEFFTKDYAGKPACLADLGTMTAGRH